METVLPPESPKSLDGLARMLRARTNRYAWIGLGIALAALILGTLLSTLLQYGTISVDALVESQTGNPALWLLDAMPFLFLIWGQYIGILLSYQASAMVLDETRDLRERAHALEFQLTRQQVAGPQLGLPNRQSLFNAIREFTSTGGEAALLVFDCPQYLDMRYTGGESAAEDLLKQTISRVQSVLRETDLLAHYDGSDFAVLMRQVIDPEEGAKLAARIQLALDMPVSLAVGAVSVRTHIGIARLPEHGTEASALLRRAETAKFAASTLGRDTLVYAPRLEAEYAERPRLAAELHGALAHDGLVDEYRLQTSLVQALPPRLRLVPVWPHPRRQRLEESQFLDLPDRLSLIYGLTLWQLSQGLSRSIAWARPEGRPQIAVRLAQNALALKDLAPSVMRLLAAHDLPPQALALEVGEPALTRHAASGARQLSTLREAGVDVCLVDLGAAGTAASTPLHFPISQVTVAAELVQQAQQCEASRKVLHSQVSLCRDLGLNVVATGVDNHSIFEEIRQLGCHWAEGRQVGGATPAAEVSRLLAA